MAGSWGWVLNCFISCHLCLRTAISLHRVSYPVIYEDTNCALSMLIWFKENNFRHMIHAMSLAVRQLYFKGRGLDTLWCHQDTGYIDTASIFFPSPCYGYLWASCSLRFSSVLTLHLLKVPQGRKEVFTDRCWGTDEATYGAEKG